MMLKKFSSASKIFSDEQILNVLLTLYVLDELISLVWLIF